ncbi:MFS transporter [Cohnella boryungensis]|uniref:MFS transporter n=1 Tax=Cohnella boryungensis TaxID=768479 RepID=A0ABV8S656_9BACL
MTLLLRDRGAILLLMLNIFLVFAGIGLVIPIIPKYMTELHITGGTVGLLVAAFSLTQLLFSPIAGRLSDAMGRKKMIIAGMLLFAVSEWIFGIASSPVPLFASRLMGGVAAALIMPAIMAYTADMTTKDERAKGMGYINAAMTTGFIIGPGLGGYIAEFGLRVPFYAAAVAGLVAALLSMLVLPESKRQFDTEEKPKTPAKRESLITQLRGSYKEPYFLSLIIVFVISFGLANYETVFGLFVDRKLGFTPQDIAFIITFGSISGAVVQATVFGWILNRFGERRVISLCLFAAGLFILLTLFAPSYWLIFAVTFVVFLSIDILRPAIGTQMSMMAEERQGYVAGLNSAFTSLGNIAGPAVAGMLFDVDMNYPYGIAALVLLISFLLSIRAGRKERRALSAA